MVKCNCIFLTLILASQHRGFHNKDSCTKCMKGNHSTEIKDCVERTDSILPVAVFLELQKTQDVEEINTYVYI
jgi:hypothetical protein